MYAKDLKKSGIVRNDYETVFLGRRSARYLDSSYKVSREEIAEIINEAMVATPSAVGSCPYKLLVLDTDEAKKKIDDIMWPQDKDRALRCSFVIIPLADRDWPDYYDDIVENNRTGCLEWYNLVGSVAGPIIPTWYEQLSAGDGAALNTSVSFQTGLLSQSLMIAARAHGLDSGFMDAWNPNPDMNTVFGVDLNRYIPQGVVCFGKSTGGVHDAYRRDTKDFVTFL